MLLQSCILIIFIVSFTCCTADPGCPDPPILCQNCTKSCPKNQILVSSPCGCCENKCVPRIHCPEPPIQCLLCHWSCAENETLEISPCGCCYNRCVPKRPNTCPKIPIVCKRCIDSCQENETLVKSPCGCCYDKCVPKVKCPKPPIQCLICHWSCPENQTLEISPCGCCYNRCVPNIPDPDPDCPPDICQLVRCALPTCKPGYILVQGQAVCGCCPGCVKPTKGDICYVDFDTGQPTCGKHCLKCCEGICIDQEEFCPIILQ